MIRTTDGYEGCFSVENYHAPKADNKSRVYAHITVYPGHELKVVGDFALTIKVRQSLDEYATVKRQYLGNILTDNRLKEIESDLKPYNEVLEKLIKQTEDVVNLQCHSCLLYTSPSPRD